MEPINRELICPHCRKNQFQILADMRLIIESTHRGLVIDKQVTNDLNDGINPFYCEGLNGVTVNQSALKENAKKVVVLCFSEECDGREMKFTDLIPNDEARITAKGW